jgi:hypothetical protein
MLQKLRMYAPTASLPLIVATAAISDAREQEGYFLSRGIGVFYKPCDIEDFLKDVCQSLHCGSLAPKQRAPAGHKSAIIGQ